MCCELWKSDSLEGLEHLGQKAAQPHIFIERNVQRETTCLLNLCRWTWESHRSATLSFKLSYAVNISSFTSACPGENSCSVLLHLGFTAIGKVIHLLNIALTSEHGARVPIHHSSPRPCKRLIRKLATIEKWYIADNNRLWQISHEMMDSKHGLTCWVKPSQAGLTPVERTVCTCYSAKQQQTQPEWLTL